MVWKGARDEAYEVPYTTLHVGKLAAGTVLNIVPSKAAFEFEIRNLAGDDPAKLIARIEAYRDQYLLDIRSRFPEAEISVEITGSYPSLETDSQSDVVAFVQGLTGSTAITKVAFGTEGGLFSSRLGVPTIVCGPGSMAQGHRPDEYIEATELTACDAMLDALLVRLREGL